MEYQGGRTANPSFEMDKDRHRREGPFDAFIDTITAPDAGNDAYLTAYNSERNREALAPLGRGHGLSGQVPHPRGRHAQRHDVDRPCRDVHVAAS